MVRLRVFVDVDGVIADFVTAFLETYIHYGILPKDFRWDRWDSMAGLDDGAVEATWQDPLLFARPQPYRGAIDALKWLNENHDTYIATAVPHRHVLSRSMWFKHHAPFIHRKNQIMFTNAKHVLDGDVLIEDNMEHILTWLDEHPAGLAIVVDHPWNEDIPNQWNIMRVKSLEQAVKELDSEEFWFYYFGGADNLQEAQYGKQEEETA
jgi:5'(3')-deoxyribonucleotidase